ncbi:MAG: signal recognition particle-docking protein FtsY [candidate division Zixibacteria bacterium]|nr:signal recognition particle-docking protein FtsY [candidate division Zixibacteria bacterium]
MREFFGRLKRGLTKTKQRFGTELQETLNQGVPLDDELFEEIETILISADCGVEVAEELSVKVRERCEREGVSKSTDVLERIKAEMVEFLVANRAAPVDNTTPPDVVLFVGVNGVGKTTSIGKIGSHYHEAGETVVFAAADTFRAAAGEQLEIWAERVGARIVRSTHGGDPAAVAFDAVKAAHSRGTQHVLIDTAGRLQSKSNLMAELSKIGRSVNKAIGDHGGHLRCLLVMDATTGQNGLLQAMEFTKAINVNGIVLTKLDGTAKGGIVLAIAHQLQIPVEWIGVGETAADLQSFEPAEFVQALFE